MVSVVNAETREINGLSTDTKPTRAAGFDMTGWNGSVIKEMDTGNRYVYDESGDTWTIDSDGLTR